MMIARSLRTLAELDTFRRVFVSVVWQTPPSLIWETRRVHVLPDESSNVVTFLTSASVSIFDVRNAGGGHVSFRRGGTRRSGLSTRPAIHAGESNKAQRPLSVPL